MVYDCAVTGGGLAGLSLSIQLADSGFSVILFEKESYPFHRVCGEYIAMESWGFLESLGIDPVALNLPRISNVKISAPNGKFIEQPLVPGGYGISRYTLDRKLAEIAAKKGVVVLENCKVEDIFPDEGKFEIKTGRGDFQSMLAVGSFGKRSNLDRKLGRKVRHQSHPDRNYVAVKYHVKADFPDNLIELHNFSGGYCGISKVEDERYCLCYLTSACILKDAGGIKQLEEKVLMKNPFLNRYFSTSRFLFDAPLTISQIDFSEKSVSENGILMAGDSAGMITPLCGNGMSMALHSSKIMAGCINANFGRPEAYNLIAREYKEKWNRAFHKRMKTGRMIQKLFGNETVTNLFISSLKPFPNIVRNLIGMTHGKPF